MRQKNINLSWLDHPFASFPFPCLELELDPELIKPYQKQMLALPSVSDQIDYLEGLLLAVEPRLVSVQAQVRVRV